MQQPLDAHWPITMECRISQDVHRRDTFLHLPLALFRQLMGPEAAEAAEAGGMCIRLEGDNVKEESDCGYSWAVPSPLLKTARACSAVIPSGRYFLARTLVPRIDRATLQAATIDDYETIVQNAGVIIERLFLEQVRIVQANASIQLWCESSGEGKKRVSLCVTGLEPDLHVGIVGIDSELEILPPSEAAIHSTLLPQEKGDSRVKELRVRKSLRVQDTPGGHVHPEHQLSGMVILNTLDGRQERLSLRSSGRLAPFRDWVYLPARLMERLGLEQHQRVRVALAQACDDDSAEYTLDKGDTRAVRNPPVPQFDAIQTLLARLLLIRAPVRGVIIQGPRMAGKSTLARRMVEMAPFPSVHLDFEPLGREKSYQAKRRVMEESFARLAQVVPCVVFLDHLDDLICCDPSEEALAREEESFLKQQLVASLLDRVEAVMAKRGSPAVLLIESEVNLLPMVRRSMLWTKTVSLAPASRSAPSTDAYHDAQVAVPLWSELPGLGEAREKLEEFLLWPILYENIYAANGHRLPGGVLLSGSSGVGKSMLARSFAQHLQSQHSSPKVLWVSGASLLGKYVGSSERAVRDLFARARENRPSLIVVEELEALAPRRGRDNTGTTDRVVNQLLTELDGAEGRDGVHVLAISSRPDLVDPALLRPGRIDCRINLTAPRDVDDRAAIIEYYLADQPALALDRSLITQIASRTDGWTGAELRGLALEAHLVARRKEIALDPDTMLDALVQWSERKREERLPSTEPSQASCMGQRVTFA